MTYIPMAKSDALKIFREELARCDFPGSALRSRRNEWKCFTAWLYEVKLITPRQYKTWTNPF